MYFLRQRSSFTNRFIPLEQYHATSLVTSGEVVARLIEFDSGDNISYSAVSVCYNKSHHVVVRQS